MICKSYIKYYDFLYCTFEQKMPVSPENKRILPIIDLSVVDQTRFLKKNIIVASSLLT